MIKKKRFWVFLWVLIALIPSYFALQSYLYWRNFTFTGISTTGTIIRLHEEEKNDSHGYSYTVYTPIFSFVANDSKKYEVQGSYSSRNTSDRLGDIVPIIYNPQQPSEAKISRFSDLYLKATALAGLALFCLFLGLWPLISRHRSAWY